MKIKVTRELKIAMLEAFRTGYLDLWKCPAILRQIQGFNLFEALLIESGLIEDEEGGKHPKKRGAKH